MPPRPGYPQGAALPYHGDLPDRGMVGLPLTALIYILIFQPSSTALASLCLWHGCVEKFGDHRGQPLGAVGERHMRRAGEHGELGTLQTAQIAYYAAADQT